VTLRIRPEGNPHNATQLCGCSATLSYALLQCPHCGAECRDAVFSDVDDACCAPDCALHYDPRAGDALRAARGALPQPAVNAPFAAWCAWHDATWALATALLRAAARRDGN
jgi:hypothetical protein